MRLILRLLIGLVVLSGSFWITLVLIDHGFFGTGTLLRGEMISEKTYDYRKGASGRIWLGAGWAWPEPFGVWTDGEQSEISIKLDGRTRRVEVDVETIAFVVPERPDQRVAVFVNDRRVATWDYSQSNAKAVRRIELAAGDLKDGYGTMVLVPRDPQSPQALALSNVDARKIAVGLVSLTVREYRN